jgi:hypothetical protein
MTVVVAAVSACSSDNTGNNTGPAAKASLLVVNGSVQSSGGSLLLDATPATLPPFGGAATLQADVGAHLLTLRSASGATLATASVRLDSVSVGTVVFSGSDTVRIAIANDTVPQAGNSGPPTGLPPHDTVGTFTGGPMLGFVLLVNGTGAAQPIQAQLVGTDSIEHFQFQGPGTPSAYSFAYVPATYTIVVPGTGGGAPLASTTITIASTDHWTVLLSKASDGTLSLTTTKQ